MFRQIRLLARKTQLKWEHYPEIADELFAKFPNTDPLTLKFTKLQELVLELEKFGDKAEACSEGKLERIQMEWLELFSD